MSGMEVKSTDAFASTSPRSALDLSPGGRGLHLTSPQGRCDPTCGVNALSEMLQANTTIRYLNLSACAIRSKEASRLAEALLRNATLTRLDLSLNDIDAGGPDCFEKALGTLLASSSSAIVDVEYTKARDLEPVTLQHCLLPPSVATAPPHVARTLLTQRLMNLAPQLAWQPNRQSHVVPSRYGRFRTPPRCSCD